MSTLRAPPVRLPPREMVAGIRPTFTTDTQAAERKWVQIALSMAVGALFVLFAMSFFGDIGEFAGGGGPSENFDDTRF